MFLLWFKPPLIRLSIHILDLELRQLLRCQVIETGKIDSYKTPDLGFVECTERMDATGLAELLMMRIGLVDVIGNRVGTREKFEVFGLGSHMP